MTSSSDQLLEIMLSLGVSLTSNARLPTPEGVGDLMGEFKPIKENSRKVPVSVSD